MKMDSLSQVLTAVLCTTKLGGAQIVQYFLVRNPYLFFYATT